MYAIPGLKMLGVLTCFFGDAAAFFLSDFFGVAIDQRRVAVNG
jgi:hypothetical protein